MASSHASWLRSINGCSRASVAELSSWNRDCMAQKAENIYCLTWYRKRAFLRGLQCWVLEAETLRGSCSWSERAFHPGLHLFCGNQYPVGTKARLPGLHLWCFRKAIPAPGSPGGLPDTYYICPFLPSLPCGCSCQEHTPINPHAIPASESISS